MTISMINWKLWNFQDIEQKISSHMTSINSAQMPSTIKIIEPLLVAGQVWADIGGGRFNNVKNLFEEKGVSLHIYDPFNRSYEENLASVYAITQGQCDGVMINNVLNVIEEKNNRHQVIQQAFDCLKEGALAYFKVYQGNKSGLPSSVKKGEIDTLQLNQKTSFYLDEISSVFGKQLKVSGELIVATKALYHNNDVDLLIKQSQQYGVPQRSKKYGVGKFIGKSIYLHKDYVSILPNSYQTALQLLKENAPTFSFNLVKYNEENQSFSFIHSPDFNDSLEPIVGDIIHINPEGVLKFILQKKDPQIYHHKWNFVGNDYLGFDIKQSIERSIEWKSKIGNNKSVSSRIGTKSYWDNLIAQDFNVETKTTSIKIK